MFLAINQSINKQTNRQPCCSWKELCSFPYLIILQFCLKDTFPWCKTEYVEKLTVYGNIPFRRIVPCAMKFATQIEKKKETVLPWNAIAGNTKELRASDRLLLFLQCWKCSVMLFCPLNTSNMFFSHELLKQLLFLLYFLFYHFECQGC